MLEAFEIYQPPQADRNKIAGKMLGHVLIVFAALAVVMVKLFLCIGADSARPANAGQSDRGYRFRTAVSRHAGDRGAANPAAGAGSDRVF